MMKIVGIIGLLLIALYFIYKAIKGKKTIFIKTGSINEIEAEPYSVPEIKNFDYKVSLTISDDVKIKETELFDFIETIEEAINRSGKGLQNLTNNNSFLTENLNIEYLTINQINEYEKKWFK